MMICRSIPAINTAGSVAMTGRFVFCGGCMGCILCRAVDADLSFAQRAVRHGPTQQACAPISQLSVDPGVKARGAKHVSTAQQLHSVRVGVRSETDGAFRRPIYLCKRTTTSSYVIIDDCRIHGRGVCGFVRGIAHAQFEVDRHFKQLRGDGSYNRLCGLQGGSRLRSSLLFLRRVPQSHEPYPPPAQSHCQSAQDQHEDREGHQLCTSGISLF
mmetsp:Transcript_4542/g.11702  ORF Transcript_4542/g.11702 Transcript_4542/m.11702 type:complete len:214 (-) Transcript_4542:115-756(-)